MHRGKDFMVDKPGMASLAQLAAVREAQRKTGRVCSICCSEHFATRSTVRAGELVAAGAIGRVVGLGLHRLDKEARPEWFFRRDMTSGILADIASHQCEQFLFLSGAEDADIAAATVRNRAHPDTPELQDFRGAEFAAVDPDRPLEADFGKIVRGRAERAFGWMRRWRRLVRDYEERCDVSQAMVFLGMGSLLLRRISHS